MPVTDIAEARDTIYGFVYDAWTAGAGGAELHYANVKSDLPGGDESWGKVSVAHADDFQATLSNETGNRRYRAVGVVTVEVRTPWGDGDAASDALVKLLLNTFRDGGAAGGIEFRNARPNEIGQDGDWYQVNVIADFEYDVVR